MVVSTNTSFYSLFYLFRITFWIYVRVISFSKVFRVINTKKFNKLEINTLFFVDKILYIYYPPISDNMSIKYLPANSVVVTKSSSSSKYSGNRDNVTGSLMKSYWLKLVEIPILSFFLN